MIIVIFLIVLPLLSYLIGSFPTGYLVSFLNNVDIRKKGSGNIGATNILRIFGRKWGYTVFVSDLIKGFFALYLTNIVIRSFYKDLIDYKMLFFFLSSIMVILGHNFPIWLQWKGGKGISTSAGIILYLFPIVVIPCIMGWFIVFLLTRYVSVASIIASLILPCSVFILSTNDHEKSWKFSIAIMIACIAIARHYDNIIRLKNGEELKFSKK